MSGESIFHCHHAPLLVVLSYTVSVLGAYCALQWASLVGRVGGWQRTRRLAAASLAMGGGAIWSMHFIAMIACHLPVAVAYDVPITLSSMVVAIVMTGAGMYVVAAAPSNRVRLVGGGLLAGLGVAAMHYTGMAAMRLPAQIVYHAGLVAASIVIAVVAATAAFAVAFTVTARRQRLLGALVMGVAVCGMHYTGMAAATFHASAAGEPLSSSAVVGTDQLGLMVFGATVFVLLLLGSGVRAVRRASDVQARTGALAAANEQLRGIIDAALDAVVTMDGRGVITEWNPQAEKIFGWTRSEAIGRTLSSTIIPPAYREAHERGLRHYLKTGEARVLNTRIEITALHRDGHEFSVELAIAPMSSAGRPAFCGFVRDITERRRAEETLRERTIYLDTLMEHSPIAIIARDAHFRVRLVNPAFERLFQYPAAEVVGADVDALISPGPDTDAIAADDLTRRVRGGETIHVTTLRRRKDGKLVDVEIYGVPLVREGKVVGTYALYHDITERRQLEAQLLHSQKIEAVGTLAGGIAHDFNNLLTTILGYSDELAAAIDEDSPLRDDLDEIRKAARQAESLTRQLLAFSRKQLAVFQVLDLADVVREMDNMIRRLVGARIEVLTETEGSFYVRADRGQIEQVLMNLVVNARDAMPAGGRLTIALGRDSGYTTLTVSDTGVGMDAETRARIFEPFFSTKETGLGTGLGLSTAYGIVKQSDGRIDVDSEPGRGARFIIWLPEVARPAERAQRPAPSPAGGGSETVLLIDDEPGVRKIARTLLARNGYRVIEAGDGDEALAAARASDGRIDLVLSDAVMPGMPVAQLITDMRALRPEARIMMMSGYTSELMIRRGILDADIPFLQKPFTGQGLLAKVREVLDVRPA